MDTGVGLKEKNKIICQLKGFSMKTNNTTTIHCTHANISLHGHQLYCIIITITQSHCHFCKAGNDSKPWDCRTRSKINILCYGTKHSTDASHLPSHKCISKKDSSLKLIKLSMDDCSQPCLNNLTREKNARNLKVNA